VGKKNSMKKLFRKVFLGNIFILSEKCFGGKKQESQTRESIAQGNKFEENIFLEKQNQEIIFFGKHFNYRFLALARYTRLAPSLCSAHTGIPELFI